MRSGSLILSPLKRKIRAKLEFALILEILIKLLLKMNILCLIADMLINESSGHHVISFLDGNAGYSQIFMAEEDTSKTAFRCPGFVGLFEWVVMTFGLKNAGATYQRAMNLIFYDLIGIILEVYIDDIVIKSAGLSHHLTDLRLALERMR